MVNGNEGGWLQNLDDLQNLNIFKDINKHVIKPVGHAGNAAVHEVSKAGPTIEKVGKTSLHVAKVAAPYAALAATMANLDQQQEL